MGRILFTGDLHFGHESAIAFDGRPFETVEEMDAELVRRWNNKVDNLSTKGYSSKYDNYAFDFMIVWPMQSATKNPEEIEMLRKMAERQKTKKIIYLTIHEPWYSGDPLKPNVDRIIQLDCENDNPQEYQRIMSAYEEDTKRQDQRNRFY